jgi:HD-GYP domain-containing protein (c-di-GMP phosphodiesterase class II)
MDRERASGFEVRLGDVVFAVSAALDLVSPAVAGHHLRTARIARALARELGLPVARRRDLVLASALHDAGGFSLGERLDLLRFEVADPGVHAEAGFRLLRHFPLFDRAASIVRFHHLPWQDGAGAQWRGSPVPAESHLLQLADRASVLPVGDRDAAGNRAAVVRSVSGRAGSRFVPEHVAAFAAVAARDEFWDELAAPGDADVREDPAFGQVTLTEADFRGLARLFWQLVDYRSRFTATHTSGVVAVADFLAPLVGVADEARPEVSIAAGLHDLGKLGVPREILDKERGLTREERHTVRDHPLHGWRVLERVPGLERVNRWASYHHERLDGTGYPFGIAAADLPLESRVVAVADVFTALTEERPYRRGLSPREATGIIATMAGDGGLDPGVADELTRSRDGAAAVRRFAQQGASERYLDFLTPSPAAAVAYPAA